MGCKCTDKKKAVPKTVSMPKPVPGKSGSGGKTFVRKGKTVN